MSIPMELLFGSSCRIVTPRSPSLPADDLGARPAVGIGLGAHPVMKNIRFVLGDVTSSSELEDSDVDNKGERRSCRPCEVGQHHKDCVENVGSNCILCWGEDSMERSPLPPQLPEWKMLWSRMCSSLWITYKEAQGVNRTSIGDGDRQGTHEEVDKDEGCI